LLDGLSDRTLLATGGLADFACGHGREHDGASGSQADAWSVCDRRGSVFGRLAASAEQQAAVIFAEMMQKPSFLGDCIALIGKSRFLRRRRCTTQPRVR